MQLSLPMLKFISTQASKGRIYHALATLNEYKESTPALRRALVTRSRTLEQDQTLHQLMNGAKAAELSHPLTPELTTTNAPHSQEITINIKNRESLRRSPRRIRRQPRHRSSASPSVNHRSRHQVSQ